MLATHRQRRTWVKLINVYITATEFSRQKYIRFGINPSSIMVKPHFVYPDPGGRHGHNQDEWYAVYAGRLSEEKGVHILLKAWENLKGMSLKIIGDGPLASELKAYTRNKGLKQVEFLGYLPSQEYERCVCGAQCVIVPSVCYENFPKVVVEAYAYGIPVVVSRLGSMEELVTERQTGFMFEPGSVPELREKLIWLFSHPEECYTMGIQARQEYEKKYTAERNYEFLLDIYSQTIEKHRREKISK
jgi:glycosyltransferase involved in cell wall biosynthesis